jgi:hypothetical protein
MPKPEDYFPPALLGKQLEQGLRSPQERRRPAEGDPVDAMLRLRRELEAAGVPSEGPEGLPWIVGPEPDLPDPARAFDEELARRSFELLPPGPSRFAANSRRK